MTKRKKPFTPDQCREFIQQYSRIRDNYVRLADVLIRVLKGPAGGLELPSMVQARAKDVSSFAGKIQRPEKGYTDPLNEITDFCGARVITLTLDGVTRICDFVESNFEIFWEDSEDKLDSLGTDTFGYLSNHYIVAFREGDFPEDVVPPDLVGLKAEIQVRTLLQHAWADVAHELSYKSAINLPTEWKRELSRLAALLEEGDRAFDRLQHDLLKYATSYRDHYTDDELVDEIARASIVLEVDPSNKGVAHKLAKLAMTLEDWQKAVDVLSGFGVDGSAEMLRDLGVSQCKLHSGGADPEAYAEGQASLQLALQKNPNDVDAWASLGGTWRTLERRAKGANLDEYRRNARECYRKAFELDHSDPYALGNFIEYEMVATSEATVLPYLRPAILDSVERCKAQAKAGVNLPWAYLSLGEFHLLLGEPLKALEYYALGVDSSTAAYFVKSPFRSFDLLADAGTTIEGMDWSRSFLELAAAINYHEAFNGDEKGDHSAPVVIVAGGCEPGDEAAYRRLVVDAFSDFKGTVICGGTNGGIAASVGELGASNPNIHTVGYVPGRLTGNAGLDDRYDEHRETNGEGFSPLEAIQYWADIRASGIPMEQVRLVAIGGGGLSWLECCMAMAFGVSTGIVNEQGDTSQLLTDPFWNAKGGAGKTLLHSIPNNSQALRAFVSKAVN